MVIPLAALAACSSAPPGSPDDVCAIFEERPSWYRHARAAEREWGVPIHVAMAFVHKESSYVSDARPPRRRLLWVIPWTRPSSAYGYAQATREAWQDYQDARGRWLADRADFDDAIDFIGWYNARSARQLGIAPDNAYHLYLAYHEGPTGYRRGSWRNNPTVQSYARRVEQRAESYRRQLARCEDDLGGGFWSWLF
ncbi:MAG TPA: hypothetical protein VF210_04400 [Pseudomonadales bacterium]